MVIGLLSFFRQHDVGVGETQTGLDKAWSRVELLRLHVGHVGFGKHEEPLFCIASTDSHVQNWIPRSPGHGPRILVGAMERGGASPLGASLGSRSFGLILWQTQTSFNHKVGEHSESLTTFWMMLYRLLSCRRPCVA